MNDNTKQFSERCARLFLSWFGLGYAPKAPGTFGSLGAIPLLYFIHGYPLYLQVPSIISLIIISSKLVDYFQRKDQSHDPQWVVVDEVLGMWVAALFCTQLTWINILLIFGTFRFFDIIKIWPASYFDRLESGFGVIFDDIISGVYTGLVLIAINKFT